MSRVIHVFRQPERFVAGTVGEPGDRSFYLQAIEDARTVSVLLEKQQVSVSPTSPHCRRGRWFAGRPDRCRRSDADRSPFLEEEFRAAPGPG
jgi:hypothetical protein